MRPQNHFGQHLDTKVERMRCNSGFLRWPPLLVIIGSCLYLLLTFNTVNSSEFFLSSQHSIFPSSTSFITFQLQFLPLSLTILLCHLSDRKFSTKFSLAITSSQKEKQLSFLEQLQYSTSYFFEIFQKEKFLTKSW